METLLLFFLTKIIYSYDIKQAHFYTLLDLKEYYISSLKNSILYIDGSSEGNLILQVFDEQIRDCYICQSKATAQTLKSCKHYSRLFTYYDNDLGYLGIFDRRYLFIVFRFISSGKIKILNNEGPYSIEVRNNQEIKFFDFYPNSEDHSLTYLFKLYFNYNYNATIKIQYASYSNEKGKINLINEQTSKNILNKESYSINNYIELDSTYSYRLEFTPPYKDKHSLLCLSFSMYEDYFVDYKNQTLPLIVNSDHYFYTYLSNSSNITGNEYNTIIYFFFNNSQPEECKLYYRIRNNSTYQKEKECSLSTKDNRTYSVEFKADRNNIVYLKLYLNSPKIKVDFNNINTFSFYKETKELDNSPTVLLFITEINETLYYILPISFLTILLFYYITSEKCNECCDCCKG